MKENIVHPIPPYHDERSGILIPGSFLSDKAREQMLSAGIRKTGSVRR